MIDEIITNVATILGNVSDVENVVTDPVPTPTLDQFITNYALDSNNRINVWFISRRRAEIIREGAASQRVFFDNTVAIDGFVSMSTASAFDTLVDNVLFELAKNISLLSGGNYILMPPSAETELAALADRLCYHVTITFTVREIKTISYV